MPVFIFVANAKCWNFFVRIYWFFSLVSLNEQHTSTTSSPLLLLLFCSIHLRHSFVIATNTRADAIFFSLFISYNLPYPISKPFRCNKKENSTKNFLNKLLFFPFFHYFSLNIPLAVFLSLAWNNFAVLLSFNHKQKCCC